MSNVIPFRKRAHRRPPQLPVDETAATFPAASRWRGVLIWLLLASMAGSSLLFLATL